jgi:tetratricopeptide (TPR) repeat protein
MIYFLTSRGFDENVKALIDEPNAPKVAILHYKDALKWKWLPRGAYIFTGIDRFGPDRLIEAARLYRRLRDHDCPVLNDPARALVRFPLLRALYRAGINPFNVYSVEEEEKPRRFPVFLRGIYGHDAPLSDMIPDQATLDETIEATIAAGVPRQTLMTVEYAAEAVPPGEVRKLSVFRVGDRLVPDYSIHDQSWSENLFAEPLKAAFDVAQIEYGRAEFGLVDGKICIYEIDTNPVVLAAGAYPVPGGVEAGKLWWEGFLAALHALDAQCAGDGSAMIDVSGHSLAALETAVALFPGLRDAHLTLSQEHAARGNSGAAIRIAKEALAHTPHDVTLLAYLCNILAEQEQFDEALAVSDRIIADNPFAAKSVMARARLLDRLGRHQEAVAEAQRAVELKPDRQTYRAFLSEVQRKLGSSDAPSDAAAGNAGPKGKRGKRRKRGKIKQRDHPSNAGELG